MMEARHFRRGRIGCAYKGKLHTMVKFNRLPKYLPNRLDSGTEKVG
jgi:hypothetical protein